MIEIHEYLDDKGESAFANWFEALDTQAALKVTTYMTRLETGNTSALKSLGKGLWECRIHWGCLLYTSPSPRDATLSRMPSSA